MPRQITRAVSIPDDVRLPANVLLFREERGRRQADLAVYLKRLRKAIPGMSVRVAETYLVAAGVPLSSSHLSRMESPTKMASMQKIDMLIVWTLIAIYNGDPDEVNRILYGRRRPQSDLQQEVQARNERINGLVAAWRLLPPEGLETIWTITNALSKQEANHLLASSLAEPVAGNRAALPFDEEQADLLMDGLLAEQEQHLAEHLRQEEQRARSRRRATDSPSS